MRLQFKPKRRVVVRNKQLLERHREKMPKFFAKKLATASTKFRDNAEYIIVS